MSLRRDDIVVFVTVKLKHRRSTSQPTMRGRDVSKKNFTGIHVRFQKDLIYSDSQLKIGRTEQCIDMDELVQEDFTYRPSSEEYER